MSATALYIPLQLCQICNILCPFQDSEKLRDGGWKVLPDGEGEEGREMKFLNYRIHAQILIQGRIVFSILLSIFNMVKSRS